MTSTFRRASTFRRTAALARAETLQFTRNTTLVVMATVFPLGIGILMYLVTRNSESSTLADAASVSMEYFLFFAMMFVQFYTVLSMVTTRRDEGVMKRLRTGEARDGEILGAFAVPGVVLTVGYTAIMVGVLLALGAPVPDNIAALVVAVILGLAVSTGFALVTSAITKNAEAAQITSFPVMALAMASTGSIRNLFPDRVAEVIDRTPFALVYDLPRVGWGGEPLRETSSAGAGEMMLILLVWAVVVLWAGVRCVRWDNRSN